MRDRRGELAEYASVMFAQEKKHKGSASLGRGGDSAKMRHEENLEKKQQE